MMKKARVRLLKKVTLLGKKQLAGKTVLLPITIADELLDTGVAVLAVQEPPISQQATGYSILDIDPIPAVDL